MSAQVAITQLPAAGAITGSELVPIVQNGVTVRTTTSAIAASPSQTQTFLTLNQEPTLPNSRRLAGGTGVGLVDNGAQSTLQITLNGASGSLEAAGTGLIAKTGASTVTARQIAVSGTGLAVSNADGVSGNPTLSLNGLIAAIAQVGGTGLLAIQNGTTAGNVLIAGTANQIAVANGNGQGGNPTISMVSDPIIPGNAGMVIPVGTSAQQPVGANGQFRFNTDTQTFDGYASGSWRQFSLSGGVTTFSAGSTGFTPASPTSGVVTLGGILNPANGGTGVNNGSSTITVAGNFTTTGAFSMTLAATASTSVTLPTSGTLATLSNTETLTNKTINGPDNNLTNIANTSLVNSSVTYNGVTVALGGSGTITASTTSTLTIGTGLSGGSFNGSAPVTIAIDLTVATLTGTQTLTNKSMSGASNTFTNIPNSALSNSTISGVALGGTLFGLTIGTGLSGGSYDGSGPVTVAIDSTVATLTGTQTLTNKSISGSTNALTNIPNSALTNSSVTIGSTNVALGGTVTTLAGLTSITLTQDPVSDLQVATKQYVDSIASGLNYHQPVNYASTAALPAYTYNNGTGGVGATITANANGALSFGGGSPTAGQRLLVKDEAGANQPYNGIYTVTQAGSAGTPFILTRATDYDTSGTGTNEIDAGDYVLVISGTNASTAWVQQTPLPITVGTTALVFIQFNAPITYTAGTGLNLSPSTTFNISNTGVTAATYGSASQSLTLAVNAQGQITSASAQSIAINGNQITSGTVGSAYISGSYTGITGVGTLTAGTWNATTIGVGYGGTGLASYTTGDLIYASGTTTLSKLGIGTSSYVLTSGGSAPQWTAPSSVSVGTATNLAGGTAGALPYQTGAGATTFLSLGTANYVLTAGATAPQYVAQSTLSVGSATNATNATNTAITANSANATNYLTFVSATSGNLGQLVNSSITVNPSTGVITGGISGGTF